MWADVDPSSYAGSGPEGMRPSSIVHKVLKRKRVRVPVEDQSLHCEIVRLHHRCDGQRDLYPEGASVQRHRHDHQLQTPQTQSPSRAVRLLGVASGSAGRTNACATRPASRPAQSTNQTGAYAPTYLGHRDGDAGVRVERVRQLVAQSDLELLRPPAQWEAQATGTGLKDRAMRSTQRGQRSAVKA